MQPAASPAGARGCPVHRDDVDEIDQLVRGLPASARRYSAWWSNEVEGRHAQARAWVDAGWRVENVNLTAETVPFATS
jgi:hypothetical protein